MFRLLLVATITTVCGCSRSDTTHLSIHQPTEAQRTPGVETRWPRKLAAKHLPNLIQVHTKVLSGGEPRGDAAFQQLRELGVKTVISVDGATPDVETAEEHGLRYIHLPHGYDGLPSQRVKELAKAVRDFEGIVYIHCHHGMHRSPSAASTACIAADMITESEGLTVLALAGTSPTYRGLYQSVREAQPFDSTLLDDLVADYREMVEVPPLAEAMVAIEHTHDHLKEIAAAGWQTPSEHPDLDPAHEALLLREQFTEVLRTDSLRNKPEAFQEMMRDSEEAAQELEHGLRRWQSTTPVGELPDIVNRLSSRISSNCKNCHQRFRDIPLSEK